MRSGRRSRASAHRSAWRRGALGKIGTDIVLLSAFGEVRERDAGGSSTMPQKRNPVSATLARACALQVHGHASVLAQARAASSSVRRVPGTPNGTRSRARSRSPEARRPAVRRRRRRPGDRRRADAREHPARRARGGGAVRRRRLEPRGLPRRRRDAGRPRARALRGRKEPPMGRRRHEDAARGARRRARRPCDREHDRVHRRLPGLHHALRLGRGLVAARARPPHAEPRHDHGARRRRPRARARAARARRAAQRRHARRAEGGAADVRRLLRRAGGQRRVRDRPARARRGA